MAKKEKQVYPRTRKEMLRIMKAADKKGQLLQTVLEEFAKHPFSMPALWDSREYFFAIKQEACSHPVLIPHLALLSAMAGRLDEAKDYVAILGKTPHHFAPQDLTQNDFYRIIAELVMPYTRDFTFLRIAFCLVKEGAVSVQSLTLSACRPSLINGFRDFTRFDPRLERYRDTVVGLAEKFYGSGGKGVYEIALAEWNYQNNDCFQALVLVTGTIPLMEQEQDMRCLFVALALQMRILLMNGQTRTAKPLVEKIRERIQETGWEELLKNGRHEAKILWGQKKRTNYYYVFIPRSDDPVAMLSKGLFEKFIGCGEGTEKRRMPPKGGEGNTTYDKVFDAVWNNTFRKL